MKQKMETKEIINKITEHQKGLLKDSSRNKGIVNLWDLTKQKIINCKRLTEIEKKRLNTLINYTYKKGIGYTEKEVAK